MQKELRISLTTVVGAFILTWAFLLLVLAIVYSISKALLQLSGFHDTTPYAFLSTVAFVWVYTIIDVSEKRAAVLRDLEPVHLVLVRLVRHVKSMSPQFDDDLLALRGEPSFFVSLFSGMKRRASDANRRADTMG
jgi:hypothetical protein